MPKAEKVPEQVPPEVAELDQKPEPNAWDQVAAAVHSIQPGDAAKLRVVLDLYPGFRDRIIQEAQAHLGNATVQQALGHTEVGAAPHDISPDKMQDMVGPPPGDLSVDDMKAKVADETDVGAGTPTLGAAPTDLSADTMKAEVAEQTAPETDADREWKTVEILVMTLEKPKDLALLIKSHPNVRARIIDEAHKQLSDADIAEGIRLADAPPEGAKAEEPAPVPVAEGEPKPGDAPTATPEPEKEKEPAWVSRARQYNDANFDLAEQFNMATSFACMRPGIDEELALDPIAISNWQQQNGIPPDGRIGPKTVELAVSLKKQSQPQVAGVDPDVMDEFKGDNQLE